MTWPDLGHRTRRLSRVNLERLYRENPATLAVLLASSAEVLVLRRQVDELRGAVSHFADVLNAHAPALEELDERVTELELKVPTFTCPKCRARSHNPNDVAQGYCARCHEWTGAGSEPR